MMHVHTDKIGWTETSTFEKSTLSSASQGLMLCLAARAACKYICSDGMHGE